LQVQGELGGIKRGAFHIIKELGLFGLYKGASACLLRFVFFCFVLPMLIVCIVTFLSQLYVTPRVFNSNLRLSVQVYFTTYSHLKKDVFNEGFNGKKMTFYETLGAAALACVISSSTSNESLKIS
jgi:solute carrier family 25 aspartate/glutamate transporter 12/13